MPARLITQVELDKLPIHRTLDLKGDIFSPRGILVSSGGSVLLVLAAAGLLRPEAWVLSGCYWLWCCFGGRERERALAGHVRPSG